MLQKSTAVLRFLWETRILRLFVITKNVLVWHLSQNIKYAVACCSHIQARFIGIVRMSKWAESHQSVMYNVWELEA